MPSPFSGPGGPLPFSAALPVTQYERGINQTFPNNASAFVSGLVIKLSILSSRGMISSYPTSRLTIRMDANRIVIHMTEFGI